MKILAAIAVILALVMLGCLTNSTSQNDVLPENQTTPTPSSSIAASPTASPSTIGYPKIGGSNEKIIRPQECPDKARFVIEQKGFADIRSCRQQEQAIDGKTAWFVEIYYGPGMDCPAGCIYAKFLGIVDGTEIHELGLAPRINFNDFIQEVCGSETKIIKYKDTYKWAVFFNGTPGGKAVYLINETITKPGLEYPYSGWDGWDTTELTINEYIAPKICSEGNCHPYLGPYHYLDFDEFMAVKGTELFDNLGINISQLQRTNNRATVEVKCVDKKAIADVEILDNKTNCKYKFNLHLDGSNDDYLGCKP
jgi:hypothetical protein